jgi:predicted dehydrogenase
VKVKIFGAGSIGNHLAHASRRLGWQVVLCDRDPAALERTRHEIYPARYGAWDEDIALHLADDAPRGADLVCVGTPPASHIPLALAALEEGPRALLVEKPLCPPDLEGAEKLRELTDTRGIETFVGYNHAVGRAARAARERLPAIGAVETLDVEFREHWGGIFAAHPWLAGPEDSYLAHWRQGGGASGEHSHAIHLWQDLAHAAGAGRVVEVTASLDYVTRETAEYDKLCLLNLVTERGLCGRVVQDVVTTPPRKWARVQGERGFVEVSIGASDALRWSEDGGAEQAERFEKTRPDDFVQELEHVQAVLDGRETSRPLALERGLETMLVIAAAHLSAREGRRVTIDHDAGCCPAALRAAPGRKTSRQEER